MIDATTDVTSNVTDATEGTSTDAVVDKDQAELDKLPLHLHPRGKELVAEKNAARREVEAYKRLGVSAEVMAEKLTRLQLLEEMVADEPDEAPKPRPGTDEFTAKAQRDWAKTQLEDLYPEIKEIKSLKELVKIQNEFITAHKVALEEEAWEATEELATEMDIEPDALAKMVIPVLQGDRKLLRMYNAGKADEAVKAAVKVLKTKIAGQTISSDIADRASRITKTTDATTRAPKTHAPGKTETVVKDTKPTTWEEAGARAQARLDKLGS